MARLRQAAVVILCLLSVSGGFAFDVQYGSLFKVKGIKLKNGLPVLPLSRNKYANVRVLDKETFEWLKGCALFCKQTEAPGKIRVLSVRAAKTRPGMWISEVAVDQKWLFSFLVFQREKQVDVVDPEGVEILDKAWTDRIYKELQGRISGPQEE